MTMFNKVTKTFQWGQHTVTLETGVMARQATGAVMANRLRTCVRVETLESCVHPICLA